MTMSMLVGNWDDGDDDGDGVRDDVDGDGDPLPALCYRLFCLDMTTVAGS